jgi:glucose-1-phosphate cytidylyltransferase
MQVVIFAGGLGTRLSEETELKPKPMVEIGGKPILWHIMKIYQTQGFNEFIICLGYKGYIIKEYFYNYFLHNSDLTIDIKNNEITTHVNNSENFKITLIDTGLNTKTAGRLKRIESYIKGDNFMLTYGDGVSDININELISFHKKTNKIATLTSVQQNNRYGTIEINEDGVVNLFNEKPKDSWINAGFFVLNKKIFDFIPEDCEEVMWEDAPLAALTKQKQLAAYKHTGFWKAMDALRDKIELEKIWDTGNAPWKVW